MFRKSMFCLGMGLLLVLGSIISDNKHRLSEEGRAILVQAAEKKKAVCKVNSLNVREDAGTEFPIVMAGGMPVSMKLQDEAEILAEKNGWYQIRFLFGKETVDGYVIKDYVEVKTEKIKKSTKTVKVAISGTVDTDALRLREDAGTTFPQVTNEGTKVLLRKNEKVRILGEKKAADGKKWYEIKADFSDKEVSGYAISDFIRLSVSKKKPIGAMIINEKGVFLKKRASTQGNFVTDKKGKKIHLAKGKKISIIEEVTGGTESLFKVQYRLKSQDYTGFVSISDLGFVYKKTVKKDTEMKSQTEEKTQTIVENTKEESGQKPNQKDEQTTIVEEITVDDQNFKAQKGFVLEDSVVLYNEPTKSAGVLTDQEQRTVIKLIKNQQVLVRRQYSGSGEKWYLITYEVGGTDGNLKKGAGFVPADKIILTGELVGQTTGFTASGKEMTEAEFSERLILESFPASYHEKLLALHSLYPNWRFQARRLLLDWEDAVRGESKVGLNLIYNSKNVAWKSLEKGAYNWKTDSFIAFDGNTYVSASEKAIRYYMDPRNFLNEKDIYQFEQLSYHPDFHTVEGIEKILAGSPMANARYSFMDESGVEKSLSYAESFLIAGVYSGVSPYHLASKVKQEVGGGGKFSASVSGDVKGYEGYYNFYNIGASDSTLPMGAVLNGLQFAKNGRKDRAYSDTITFNQYIKLPWNNPYKAILGGAAYIGENYTKKGQDTLYLQKFNLTEYSTFFHQYMSNIEGPYRESAHVRKAYKDLESLPLVFSIPVLENMPTEPNPMPVDEKNPNHWLSSLEVKGYRLTPSFSPAITDYTLVVKKEEKQVEVIAKPVSNLSEVIGNGITEIKDKGETRIEIMVRAENGSTRSYRIGLARE